MDTFRYVVIPNIRKRNQKELSEFEKLQFLGSAGHSKQICIFIIIIIINPL